MEEETRIKQLEEELSAARSEISNLKEGIIRVQKMLDQAKKDDCLNINRIQQLEDNIAFMQKSIHDLREENRELRDYVNELRHRNLWQRISNL